jgi:hypothetical protein
MIGCSGEANSWAVDVDKIQREIMVSEYLADLLLTRKIERLPDFKDTMKVASLLGYQFGDADRDRVV